MAPPGIQLRTWTLFFCLSWMFVCQVTAKPQYLVAVPTVIESGTESKFCVSLLQPSEALVMTVTLNSGVEEITLLQKTSSNEFHECFQFQAPVVKDQTEYTFRVRLQGDTYNSEDVKRVVIKNYRTLTFIQTDKPLYLPGQTVHFRVVSLDSKFRPAMELYNTVEIQDFLGHRIGQWLNRTSNGKILQLSYSLSSEAREGGYYIKVWTNNGPIIHMFKVKRYVLPKFDVKVKASDEISIAQEVIEVEVCATYTYGQSVPGSVEIEMLRPLHPEFIQTNMTSPNHEETKQMEKNGCATFRVEISTFTKVFPQIVQDKLIIYARVTEEGTGVVRSAFTEVKLSYIIGKLSFIETPASCKPGSILEGKIKMVTIKDEPVPDKPLYLFLLFSSEAAPLLLRTDNNGIATFKLNATDILFLRASSRPDMEPMNDLKTPFFEDASHTILLDWPSLPKSYSSLTVMRKVDTLPCDKEERFSIQYAFVEETRRLVDVMYLVVSQGNIVMQGHQKVEVPDDSVTEGEISFILKVTPEMSPESHIVAYAVLANEIVIAGSGFFKIQKCFTNKVSLGFNPPSAVPGEEATLQLSALPGSLCGVNIIDQSVLIEVPGNTLETDKIFDMLPEKSSLFRWFPDPETCLRVRQTRSPNEDALPLFEAVGLKVATNVFTKMPSCVIFLGKEYYERKGAHGEEGRISPQRPGVDFILSTRTFFPETWIWNLVQVGDSGSVDYPLTAPDTITTWEAEAFCLSPQGFGLAPRKTFTVFQPFFLELTMPYSIIRGEHFELKATVFNYLTDCLMVSVSAAHSLDYTLTALPGEEYTSCVCGNERKTYRWTMSPAVLGVVNVTVSAEAVESQRLCGNMIPTVPERGRMDRITKSLIVKAEGSENSKTFNWLLCPKGETLTEEVELQLPHTVIEGSARVSVSVLGDVVGRALNNLDKVLEMPEGSGVQNIALFASNVYILQYLKNTQQLTKDILEKATNFLTSGYQKLLNFKHEDGTFSMFGEENDKNIWLTAFVLKSFVQAQPFIFIDTNVISKSWSRLFFKQDNNGCFGESGGLYGRMQGGVSDEVTLTAYITAAVLEMNMPLNPPEVKKNLSCLQEYFSDFNKNYTTALLAYRFTLAGDMKTRALLLEQLDSVALHQGDLLYWCDDETETSSSLCVEISSYVLLARLSASPSAEELHYCTRIVKWLIRQQNKYGGFSSTQDTVVALQALALYSTKVFSPDGSSKVIVQAPSKKLEFDVNPNNRLLYQEEALEDLTGKYRVKVKGAACASVQIVLQYNTRPRPQHSVFTLQSEVFAAPCTSPSQELDLIVKFVNEIQTNMVIMEIKMLSGYAPDPVALKALRMSKTVHLVEHKGDQIWVHCQELQIAVLEQHMFQLVKVLPVENLKPATIKIYDYYESKYRVEAEYKHPCAAG